MPIINNDDNGGINFLAQLIEAEDLWGGITDEQIAQIPEPYYVSPFTPKPRVNRRKWIRKPYAVRQRELIAEYYNNRPLYREYKPTFPVNDKWEYYRRNYYNTTPRDNK